MPPRGRRRHLVSVATRSRSPSRRSVSPTVRRVLDAFKCVEHVLTSWLQPTSQADSTWAPDNVQLRQFAKTMFGLTLSTSFSGIGAPEFACDCITHSLCAILCLPLACFAVGAADEMDHMYRQELPSSQWCPQWLPAQSGMKLAIQFSESITRRR